MWSNTDKGQLERCDQIQINKAQLERYDQIQIKVNLNDVIKYR